MSRRKRQPESSLELLLDTICNTFGGILFLSILIVVLLQMTGGARSKTAEPTLSAAELADLRRQHAEALRHLETVQAAIDKQRDLLDQFATAENVDLLRELQALEQTRESLRSHRAATISQIAEAQASVDAVESDLAELDQHQKELEQQVAVAERLLQAEVASRTTAARLPRQHATGKQEVGVLVRYGRLYLWHKYDSHGLRLGLNFDDMVVVKEHGTRLETAPKPFAGVVLEKGVDAERRIREKLSGFDPRTMYVAVVIWEDSFAQFQILKNVLVERGLEYRLMPTEEGTEISDHGGTGSRVQ
ncbi:MAG: hypothetical protein HYX69_17900 [Planctomycetia bacterium]|nr:hypothetical protein [Planctomycetia bacterium]